MYLAHLRKCKCKNLRARFSTSMYFLYLPRARFNDNIALCDRKRVRNSYTRVGIHGGDKYSIFRSYWLRIFPRAQITAVPSLYRDEQCRYHQNSLPGAQMIRSSIGNIRKTKCIGLKRSFRFFRCGQYLDNKIFRNDEDRTYVYLCILMYKL